MNSDLFFEAYFLRGLLVMATRAKFSYKTIAMLRDRIFELEAEQMKGVTK